MTSGDFAAPPAAEDPADHKKANKKVALQIEISEDYGDGGHEAMETVDATKATRKWFVDFLVVMTLLFLVLYSLFVFYSLISIFIGLA